jgi:hypothetical protein
MPLERIIVNLRVLLVESLHRFGGFLRIEVSVFVSLPIEGFDRLEQIECDNNHNTNCGKHLAGVFHFGSLRIGKRTSSTSKHLVWRLRKPYLSKLSLFTHEITFKDKY